MLSAKDICIRSQATSFCAHLCCMPGLVDGAFQRAKFGPFASEKLLIISLKKFKLKNVSETEAYSSAHFWFAFLRIKIRFRIRVTRFGVSFRSGVGNLRPTGRMRPAKAFYPVRDLLLSSGPLLFFFFQW